MAKCKYCDEECRGKFHIKCLVNDFLDFIDMNADSFITIGLFMVLVALVIVLISLAIFLLRMCIYG